MPVAVKHAQGCRPLEFYFPPAGRGDLNRNQRDHGHNHLFRLNTDLFGQCWPPSHVVMGGLVCKHLRQHLCKAPKVKISSNWNPKFARECRKEGVGSLYSGAHNFLRRFAGKVELHFSATLFDHGNLIEALNTGRIWGWGGENMEEECLDLFLEDARCFFEEVQHARDKGWGGASALYLSLPSLKKLPNSPEHYTGRCGGLGNVFVASLMGMTSLRTLWFDSGSVDMETDSQYLPVVESDRFVRKLLPTLVSLTTLVLPGSCIEVAAFSDALGHCTQMSTLDLSWSFIGRQSFQPLAQSLTKLSRLSCLNMDGIGLGDEGAADLAEALPHLPRLKRLHIAQNQMDGDGAKKLAQSLGLCSNLERLILGRAGIDCDETGNDQFFNDFACSTRELAPALRLCPKLKQITIQEDIDREEHGENIADLLSNCSALESLGFYDCLVEPGPAHDIALAYPHCTNLTSLVSRPFSLCLACCIACRKLPCAASHMELVGLYTERDAGVDTALAKLCVQTEGVLDALPKCAMLTEVDVSVSMPREEELQRFCQDLPTGGRAWKQVRLAFGDAGAGEKEEAMLDLVLEALQTAGVRAARVFVGDWDDQFGEEKKPEDSEEEGEKAQ